MKYETKEIKELWNTYLIMLLHQIRGDKYSKTKYRNEHLEKHEGRTRGSYEAFMMNISTARHKVGLKVLKGYKPSMPNYNKYLDKLANNEFRTLVGEMDFNDPDCHTSEVRMASNIQWESIVSQRKKTL